ncbi:hypothetical protein WJX73_003463 [Symbiochloris irregularis]|uniref:6,7-dimethyl-8-ribityllumazine synthase n=1 Tax=Symbiochloris irregularis TaxID=706552 RepID=A0AAW1P184_9CHLO
MQRCQARKALATAFAALALLSGSGSCCTITSSDTSGIIAARPATGSPGNDTATGLKKLGLSNSDSKNGLDGISHLYGFAKANGVMLLAPESRSTDWDFIVSGSFGPDVAYINDALAAVFARYDVQQGSIGMQGFSDGASYAIMLGLANGNLFNKGPEAAACSLVQAGYTVAFVTFSGGHEVPCDVGQEALQWFLGKQSVPARSRSSHTGPSLSPPVLQTVRGQTQHKGTVHTRATKFEGALSASGLRIGIVVGRFNDLITKLLLEGALAAIERHGGNTDEVDVAWVPGSFELPVVAKTMAKSGTYDAVLVIGVVVRGATSHYDAVVSAATSGVLNAGLDTGVPVIFGVLTTDTMEQAFDRAGGKAGNKGFDQVPGHREACESGMQSCHSSRGSFCSEGGRAGAAFT